jgi:hypothetical protein
MPLTITQKADTLGTLRFVFVRLMETLAGWVPTSPELEVKVLFGRHIWVLAQHADIVGQRTLELRAKLHYERRPTSLYQDALQMARGAATSGDRAGAFYDAWLPDLRGRLSAYLADTDPLLDAPTVDIFERILRDFDRMERDMHEVAAQRPDVLQVAPSASTVAVRDALQRCSEFVDHRESVTA